MSAFSFCGVLLDTQSNFQIVIERICDGVDASILAGITLAILVRDDGLDIVDAVNTHINRALEVTIFAGAIFKYVGSIDDRSISRGHAAMILWSIAA